MKFEWRGKIRDDDRGTAETENSDRQSGKYTCSKCGSLEHTAPRCQQTEVTRIDRFCPGCGKLKPWTHSGGKSVFCVACSRLRRAIKPRPCAGCGVEFTPAEGDRRVCSEQCRRTHLSRLHLGTHERLAGKVFGWWSVLSHDKAEQCVCRCRCGYDAIVKPDALKNGKSLSCRRCVAARRLESMTPEEMDALTATRNARRRESYAKHYQIHRERIQASRTRLAPSEESRGRALEQLRETRTTNRALVNKLKDAPCMDCGGIFPPECMDFDHLPGETKVADVSKLAKTGRSSDVILAEIAKCDLVCSNCHRVRTLNRHRGIE